jgi:hypothetical protein
MCWGVNCTKDTRMSAARLNMRARKGIDDAMNELDNMNYWDASTSILHAIRFEVMWSYRKRRVAPKDHDDIMEVLGTKKPVYVRRSDIDRQRRVLYVGDRVCVRSPTVVRNVIEDQCHCESRPRAMSYVKQAPVRTRRDAPTDVLTANEMRRSGGHTTAASMRDLENAITVPQAKPNIVSSRVASESSALVIGRLKLTVKETIADIEQGSFSRDRYRHAQGSGSERISDEVICDPAVAAVVRNHSYAAATVAVAGHFGSGYDAAVAALDWAVAAADAKAVNATAAASASTGGEAKAVSGSQATAAAKPTIQVVEQIQEIPEIQVAEKMVEVPQVAREHVDQILDQVVEIPKIIAKKRIRRRSVEMIADVPVPMMQKDVALIPTLVNRHRHHHVEQDVVVDVRAPYAGGFHPCASYHPSREAYSSGC